MNVYMRNVRSNRRQWSGTLYAEGERVARISEVTGTFTIVVVDPEQWRNFVGDRIPDQVERALCELADEAENAARAVRRIERWARV